MSDAPIATPKQQFSLAQLLAIVLAAAVALAAGRVLTRIPDVRPLEWILVLLGFVLACVVLFAVRIGWLGRICVTLALLFALVALISPALGTARNAALRSVCSGQLKKIAVALHNYHDEYGVFPPAVVRDASGQPLHSWRVLLLPYLEQQKLYARYRLDEPWDGPNNQKLHSVIARCYSCDAASRLSASPLTETAYVVIVGPRTAFPEDRCVALSDITDNHGNTLLAVEIFDSGIHWMEPRDLHVTQMSRQINPSRGQGISSPHPTGGANVVMVDGSLRFLTDQTPDSTLERLLTIGGGEPVVWEH